MSFAEVEHERSSAGKLLNRSVDLSNSCRVVLHRIQASIGAAQVQEMDHGYSLTELFAHSVSEPVGIHHAMHGLIVLVCLPVKITYIPTGIDVDQELSLFTEKLDKKSSP